MSSSPREPLCLPAIALVVLIVPVISQMERT